MPYPVAACRSKNFGAPVPSWLASGLVSFYKLADTSDSFGSNTLTNNNTATFGAGKIGNAVHLVRASQQTLSIADAANGLDQSGDFTITAWVYLESKPASLMYAVGKWNDGIGTQRSYRIGWNNSTDRFFCTVANSAGTDKDCVASNFGAPSLATWYFLCLRNTNATEVELTVNNTAETPAAHALTINDSTIDFRIGSTSNVASLSWDGRIDAVGIWSRRLTDDEVTDLYNGGTGREP